MQKTTLNGSLSGKLVACVLVLACVAVGVVGLVLPVIPGLLFLAIAALIAARHFPSLAARLRRHRAFDRHLNKADGFLALRRPQKIQVAGWLCVKVFLDSLAFSAARDRGRPCAAPEAPRAVLNSRLRTLAPRSTRDQGARTFRM
jgi:uncharacterized membrane protein YbaN (DUF454 family)